MPWRSRTERSTPIPSSPSTRSTQWGPADAFVGAFLAELVKSSSIDTCLASGAKMGALVCAVPGDWEGTLDWSNDDTRDADVRR